MRYHESEGIKAALVTVLVLSVSSLLIPAAHADGTGGSARTVRVGYVILKTIRRAAKANTSAALATRICSASPIRPAGSMNTSATPSASCCKSGRTARSTCSACCTATSAFRSSMVFQFGRDHVHDLYPAASGRFYEKNNAGDRLCREQRHPAGRGRGPVPRCGICEM